MSVEVGGGAGVPIFCVRYAACLRYRVPIDQVPLAIDEFRALCGCRCAEGRTVLRGAEELRGKGIPTAPGHG